jgi:ribosomal protein S18 acetylase RimI-like enzyme
MPKSIRYPAKRHGTGRNHAGDDVSAIIFRRLRRSFSGLLPVIHTVNPSLTIGLEGRKVRCFYREMNTTLIEIRRAKSSDAVDVAETHDEAWRTAYQGIIPGNELEKLINRRGPDWWDSAIRKGSRITILQFGERVAGYANYGRNRARSLFYDGEIYELYLRPEFQGLGFGRRLFSAARKDLNQSGLKSLVVWALSDNEPAMEFYRALGGRAVARSSERFGAKTLDKVAYAWQA